MNRMAELIQCHACGVRSDCLRVKNEIRHVLKDATSLREQMWRATGSFPELAKVPFAILVRWKDALTFKGKESDGGKS